MKGLLELIRERKSTRAFRGTPVPRALLEQIFSAAQHAPSWCNIQPWQVIVTSGEATRRLTQAISDAARANPQGAADYPFPPHYPEPYRTRRIDCAKALYGVMGIEREDKAGRDNAWMRNFYAFDAPHVAMVSVHEAFGVYGALDIGCWLQSLLLAAHDAGLASCALASLASYPAAVRAVLNIPEDHRILVGVALGYVDDSAPANRCVTTREPLRSNVLFMD